MPTGSMKPTILEGAKPKRLAELTMPVLFVTSEQDQLIPASAVHLAAELLKNARVEHFDQVGHSSYFECADEFNALVLGFLEEQTS